MFTTAVAKSIKQSRRVRGLKIKTGMSEHGRLKTNDFIGCVFVFGGFPACVGIDRRIVGVFKKVIQDLR